MKVTGSTKQKRVSKNRKGSASEKRQVLER